VRLKAVLIAVCVVAVIGSSAACTSADRPAGPSSTVVSTTASTASTASGVATTPIAVGAVSVIASGLAVPWGVAFLPDGSALVSERDSHRIVRVAANGTVTAAGTVSGVAPNAGEGGLLGLALSPSFGRDALVYAYLTSATDNRIVRMPYREGTLGPASPVFTGIPKAAIHNGGRIAFGPDGQLYVTAGDASQKDRAQDVSYLGGKVLRMTPDGRPAPGNPFPNSVVYTLGHRNPQGLAWAPDGSLYEAEFGQSSLDELNLIEPGRNYGWPDVEGTIGANDAAGTEFTAPLLTWPTGVASPSGLAFAGGALWLATLQGKRVYRIPVLGPGRVSELDPILTGDYGRLRTVAVAPDGSLWITTSNRDGRGDPIAADDRIVRVALG
jgi:glucose/arabinose dehydrogenase